MKLRISRNAAQERLTMRLSDGHRLLTEWWTDYRAKIKASTFNPEVDIPEYRRALLRWIDEVQRTLVDIFPTQLELHRFSIRQSVTAYDYQGINERFARLAYTDMPMHLERLSIILRDDLGRYSDLPNQDRLFVEDIDSFSPVRDVNSALVQSYLSPRGYLPRSEDQIQIALEQILNVPFHKNDWGGETCDLYTANIIINGARRAGAFLLKGPGIGEKVMTIADCGKNGDQIVRLFTNPADLFVVQSCGPISEAVVQDVAGKVSQRRSEGKGCNFLIMDGQDTARVLYAFGKLS